MSYQLASQGEGIKLLWQPIRPWFEDLGPPHRLCLVAITSGLILFLHANTRCVWVCVYVCMCVFVAEMERRDERGHFWDCHIFSFISERKEVLQILTLACCAQQQSTDRKQTRSAFKTHLSSLQIIRTNLGLKHKCCPGQDIRGGAIGTAATFSLKTICRTSIITDTFSLTGKLSRSLLQQSSLKTEVSLWLFIFSHFCVGSAWSSVFPFLWCLFCPGCTFMQGLWLMRATQGLELERGNYYWLQKQFLKNKSIWKRRDWEKGSYVQFWNVSLDLHFITQSSLETFLQI